MQSHYDAAFDREMGCTEGELLGWLPGATAPHPLVVDGALARVVLPGGEFRLTWQVLPERRIALMALPRLATQFRFDAGIEAAVRNAFMRRFDLYTQRGGG